MPRLGRVFYQKPVGRIDLLFEETPIAGNQVIQAIVPLGKRWKVQAVHIDLVTDATAGNRYALITIYLAQSFMQMFQNKSGAQAANLDRMHIFTYIPTMTPQDVSDPRVSYQTWLHYLAQKLELAENDKIVAEIIYGASGDAWSFRVMGEETEDPYRKA